MLNAYRHQRPQPSTWRRVRDQTSLESSRDISSAYGWITGISSASGAVNGRLAMFPLTYLVPLDPT